MKLLTNQKAIILDTCVLPQRGSIHSNPLLSALIRIAGIRGFVVCISDITRSESINKRKTIADEAVSKLEAAIGNAEKVFRDEELVFYLPSSDDAVTLWREELDASFTTLPVGGDDALEALQREAARRPPARATADGSAIGARDAAIWLSVKRLHLTSVDQVTYFVSSNSSDFSSKSNKLLLREELVEELGDSADRFSYYLSVVAAVESLAEKSPVVEIDWNMLRQLVEVAEMEPRLLQILKSATPGDSDVEPISLSVNSATEKRAYVVEDTRVSQLKVEFACLSVATESGAPDPVEPIRGDCTMWVQKDEDSTTFEVESLTFGEVTLRHH